MISTKDFIENIQSECKKVLFIVDENFSELSQNQLSWKPSPKRWSVGECFLHLMNVNDYYLKIYIEYSGKNSNGNNSKHFPFKNSFMGKQVIKFVKPEAKLKTKTSKYYDPHTTSVPADTIENFLEQHKNFMHLLEELKNIDLQKIKIVSPFSNFIKYNLGDSMEMIVSHDQRHLLQAKNVMKMKDFPTK